MSELISFKQITGLPAEIKELQKVLDLVPDYTRRTRSEEQGPHNAQELFEKLPEGVAQEQRVLYGLYFNHRMIGCLDIIKGYPDERVAFVAHLIIAEDVQGAGLGSEAFKEIEKIVRSWETVDRIRIGIHRTNDFVQNFWRKMGFRKTGESAHYESGNLKTKLFFMDKSLKGHVHSNKGAASNGQQNNRRPNNNNRKNHSRHQNQRHHGGGGQQAAVREASEPVVQAEPQEPGNEANREIKEASYQDSDNE